MLVYVHPSLLDDCYTVPLCCLCVELKLGCKLIAFSSVVPLVVIILVVVCSNMYDYTDFGFGERTGAYAMYCVLVLSIGLFIFSAILLVGLYVAVPLLLDLYVWYLLIHGCIATPLSMCAVLAALGNKNIELGLVLILVTIVHLSIIYHYFVVTNSYRTKNRPRNYNIPTE